MVGFVAEFARSSETTRDWRGNRTEMGAAGCGENKAHVCTEKGGRKHGGMELHEAQQWRQMRFGVRKKKGVEEGVTSGARMEDRERGWGG